MLKELLKYLSVRNFLTDFTTIKINGGIRHRLAGRGTNKSDKVEDLREEEKVAIKAAWYKLVEHGNTIIEKL